MPSLLSQISEEWRSCEIDSRPEIRSEKFDGFVRANRVVELNLSCSHGFRFGVRTFRFCADVLYGCLGDQLTAADHPTDRMSSISPNPYLVAVKHLGIQTAESLCASLQEHAKVNPAMLVDLSPVETYDPIGVQLLYSCQKTSADVGQPFSVVNAAPSLKGLMESLGLPPGTLRGIDPESTVSGLAGGI